MNPASDDPAILRFYDHLFIVASAIIKRGEEHAPIVIVISTAGVVTAKSLMGLQPDDAATLFKSMPAERDVRAAALVMESWYVDGQLADPESRTVLELASQGRLSEHPARKEAVVISILTATRQAVMICPIDRSTNTLQKRPFQWLTEGAESFMGRFIRSSPTATA
jgi:hypothetical protein